VGLVVAIMVITVEVHKVLVIVLLNTRMLYLLDQACSLEMWRMANIM
jgi:hypothetical protein